jgi:prophage antirepressor-like protein
VAKDVAEALGIANHRDALSRLDNDEKDDVGITDTIGRTQQNSTINESGLFKLVFSSRKEEAKRFTKWVTSEVLPTIRKTGKYEAAITTPAHFTVVIRGKFSVKLLSTLNFLLWKVWKFITDDL